MTWHIDLHPETGEWRLLARDNIACVVPVSGEQHLNFIVTAVNHHDELVAALRTARGQIVGFSIPEIGAEAAVKNVEYIDALLAKIGGGA